MTAWTSTDELGANPDVITLTSLADWAEGVIG